MGQPERRGDIELMEQASLLHRQALPKERPGG
jgi:hypothetical protein